MSQGLGAHYSRHLLYYVGVLRAELEAFEVANGKWDLSGTAVPTRELEGAAGLVGSEGRRRDPPRTWRRRMFGE
jgi:hypothetical protein